MIPAINVDFWNQSLNGPCTKDLKWYGHMQRMDEERLPRRIFEWCPPGRRRKRRLRNSWRQEVTKEMREKVELATWNGSTKKGGEKNKFTLDTERSGDIKNLYINK